MSGGTVGQRRGLSRGYKPLCARPWRGTWVAARVFRVCGPAPVARLVSCGAPPRRRLRARARAAAGRRAPGRARRRRRSAMRRARERARRCLNPMAARVRARASMPTKAHRKRPYKSGTLLTQRWQGAAREVGSRSRKRAATPSATGGALLTFDGRQRGWGFAHVRAASRRFVERLRWQPAATRARPSLGAWVSNPAGRRGVRRV